MKLREVLSVSVFCSLILAGCGGGGAGGGSSSNSSHVSVRGVVLFPAPNGANLWADSKLIAAGIHQNQTTNYISVRSGTSKVMFSDEITGTVLAQAPIGSQDGRYTVYGYKDGQGNPAAAVVADAPTSSTTAAELRFTDLASATGAVDVYVSPNQVIDDKDPVAAGLTAGNASSYQSLAQGSYYVFFTDAGTKNVVFGTRIAVQSGQIRSLVLENSDSGPVAFMMTDNS